MRVNSQEAVSNSHVASVSKQINGDRCLWSLRGSDGALVRMHVRESKVRARTGPHVKGTKRPLLLLSVFEGECEPDNKMGKQMN